MDELSSVAAAQIEKEFRYTPLYEDDAIRLIFLHPSPDRDAPIRCSIILTTLEAYDRDTINHYTALSYVWGNATDLVSISVNSQDLKVTRNLWTALRDIRHEESDRAMWIDAICINQQDQKEKSIQVAQMWKVYKTADHTIIYLGLAAQYWTDLIDMIRQKCHFNSGKWRHVVEEFLGQTWFHRVWCFQELAYSKDPWLQCGRQAIRWERMVDFFTLHQELALETNLMTVFDDMQSAREQIRRQVGYRTVSAAQFYQSLKEIMSARRAIGVSDSRDMIYAHVGLARSMCGLFLGDILPIRPDYTLTVSQVYEDFAIQLLTNSEYEIFSLAESKVDFCLRTGELPSWVPDWTLGNPYVPQLSIRRARKQYRKSRKFVGNPTTLDDEMHQQHSCLQTWAHGKMISEGGILGMLESVSKALLPTSFAETSYDSIANLEINDDFKGNPDIENDFREKVFDISISSTSKLAETASEAVMHEIATSLKEKWQEYLLPFRMSTHGNLTHDSFDNYYESIFNVITHNYLHPPNHQPVSPSESLDNCFPLFHDRKLATLDTGVLALVPYLAQKGDVVAMLKGDDVPLLLRPVEVSPKELEMLDAEIQVVTEDLEKVLLYRNYLFVGECWVEGAMSAIPKSVSQQKERRNKFGMLEELVVIH